MSEESIQGSCVSCGSIFPILFDELEDDMQCPKCGEDANITAICHHCGQNIKTNGRMIGCSFPCPDCGVEFFWNTVKATDGTSMVVSMTGRIEMHDIASAVSTMQKQLEQNQAGSNLKDTASNSKGCLGSFVLMVSIGTGIFLLAAKYIV